MSMPLLEGVDKAATFMCGLFDGAHSTQGVEQIVGASSKSRQHKRSCGAWEGAAGPHLKEAVLQACMRSQSLRRVVAQHARQQICQAAHVCAH